VSVQEEQTKEQQMNLYQSWAYLILLAEVHSATGKALHTSSMHNITSAANCESM